MTELIKEIIENKKTLNCNEDYYKKIKHVNEFRELDLKVSQIDFVDMLNYLKENNLLEYLKLEIENLNKEFLYKSETHGINHNLRVMIHTLYLVSILNLNKRDIDVAMKAAAYHDIGRVNDNTDDDHGGRSASKIEEVIECDYIDLNMLKAVIELHSINDDNFDKIASKYNIENKDRLKILYSVLKDADALDRVRLTYELNDYSELDIRFLRLDESLTLVKAAHQLNECFVKKLI